MMSVSKPLSYCVDSGGSIAPVFSESSMRRHNQKWPAAANDGQPGTICILSDIRIEPSVILQSGRTANPLDGCGSVCAVNSDAEEHIAIRWEPYGHRIEDFVDMRRSVVAQADRVLCRCRTDRLLFFAHPLFSS